MQEHCQSAGFYPFSPLFIYSGPPAYGMPTLQSGSLSLALTSLETSSQQEPRVCLLGDSKHNQGNKEDSHQCRACLSCSVNELI